MSKDLQTLRKNLKMPLFPFSVEPFQLKHRVKKSWKINFGEKGVQVPVFSEHFIRAGFYPIGAIFLDCLIWADVFRIRSNKEFPLWLTRL